MATSTYIREHISNLLLIEELEHAGAQRKEVGGLTSQIDGSWICFEGIQDAS